MNANPRSSDVRIRWMRQIWNQMIVNRCQLSNEIIQDSRGWGYDFMALTDTRSLTILFYQDKKYGPVWLPNENRWFKFIRPHTLAREFDLRYRRAMRCECSLGRPSQVIACLPKVIPHYRTEQKLARQWNANWEVHVRKPKTFIVFNPVVSYRIRQGEDSGPEQPLDSEADA